jgi:hypothetical protein
MTRIDEIIESAVEDEWPASITEPVVLAKIKAVGEAVAKAIVDPITKVLDNYEQYDSSDHPETRHQAWLKLTATIRALATPDVARGEGR